MFTAVIQSVSAHIDYKILYEDLLLKFNDLSEKYTTVSNDLQFQVESLKQQLDALKKIIFGSKQERFIPFSGTSSSQLALDIQAEAVASCDISNAKKIEYIRTTKEVAEKKEHPGRMKLPEHLERREKVIEPAEDVSGCKKIGEEVTEELEYEPGKLFVNRYIRPKYAKPGGEGIITAPMIERPLPKAIAGAGLLAQIVIDKYVDHLPLYRQMERFKRESINIPYSTITDWVSNTCKLILPLYEALKLLILQSDYLHADESPVKVLDKDKKGETHRGYFWVYHNSIERLVLFDYQPGRGREGPQEILKDFKGHLQTDGYAVYDFFKGKEDITLLHCMAHARRMFYEALSNDKARAEYALQQIALLYSIERKAKEQFITAEQLYEIRQTQSLPILRSLSRYSTQSEPSILR